jgi:hypothetical protein
LSIEIGIVISRRRIIQTRFLLVEQARLATRAAIKQFRQAVLASPARVSMNGQ